MFLYPTSFVPSTVHEDKVPDAGVPSAGVTNVALVNVGVVNEALVANTFEPVPVFVTLTKALEASVATALEAVKLE